MLLKAEHIEVLESFLKEYKPFLDSHNLKKLENLVARLYILNENGTITSRFGEHYKNCIWADNKATSGPDTCVCISVTYKYRDALKAIQHFKNIYEKLIARMENLKL